MKDLILKATTINMYVETQLSSVLGYWVFCVFKLFQRLTEKQVAYNKVDAFNKLHQMKYAWIMHNYES